MLKHKSLIMVSVLVLVLAVVAMSCAPAKPVTPPVVTPPVVTPPVVTPPVVAPPAVAPAVVTPPVVTPPAAPAVEIKTSFEAATYTNAASGFSVKYPKTWVEGKVVLKGGVFYATGDDGLVYIAVRPATDFKAAALTFLADLIALKANITPELESEKALTFADGTTKGNEIMLSALFGSQKASIYGLIKDGNAIMVMCGTNPKNVALYKEVGATLSVK